MDEAIPLNEYSAINIEDEIMKTVKLIILPMVCFKIKSFNNKQCLVQNVIKYAVYPKSKITIGIIDS